MAAYDTLLNMGIAAARAGDREQARRLLTQAVRRHPDSAEAWLWLGNALTTPQGQAFCLKQALAIDPTNQLAQRGLAALEKVSPAPAIVARPAQAPIPERPALLSRLRGWVTAELAPTGHLRRLGSQLTSALSGGFSRLQGWVKAAFAPSGRLRRLVSQPRFWQVAVACLGVVALALIGALIFNRPAADDSITAGLAASNATPEPQHTLRPTFTPRPTATPLPTDTPVPTPTDLPPTATPTPSPSATATPTPTSTRRARAVAAAVSTSTPQPTLPPLKWDPRLDTLGVRLEPARVPPGVGYWRLIEARWADGEEARGDHTIYVEVINPKGARVVGQPVIFEWSSGSLILPVEDRPAPDWGVNFPMFSTLGSYAARVGVEPSDRVVGMGLGTAGSPNFTIHTNFFLVFRWVLR